MIIRKSSAAVRANKKRPQSG